MEARVKKMQEMQCTGKNERFIIAIFSLQTRVNSDKADMSKVSFSPICSLDMREELMPTSQCKHVNSEEADMSRVSFSPLCSLDMI
jgi:hypothetical protein